MVEAQQTMMWAVTEAAAHLRGVGLLGGASLSALLAMAVCQYARLRIQQQQQLLQLQPLLTLLRAGALRCSRSCGTCC